MQQIMDVLQTSRILCLHILYSTQKTHLFQLEKREILSTKISDSKCFSRLKEIFSAPVRATALGAANVVARVCTAFGPFLVSWRKVFFGFQKKDDGV